MGMGIRVELLAIRPNYANVFQTRLHCTPGRAVYLIKRPKTQLSICKIEVDAVIDDEGKQYARPPPHSTSR